jgi:hypothetical protein
MSTNHVAAYLNDHLAGAIGGIELAEHLANRGFDPAVAAIATPLLAEIREDRQTLEQLMQRLHIAPSHPRQAATWLMAKAGELKAAWDDPAGGALRLLQTTEALSLGIAGKEALWSGLAAAAEQIAALKGPVVFHNAADILSCEP